MIGEVVLIFFFMLDGFWIWKVLAEKHVSFSQLVQCKEEVIHVAHA